MTSAASSERGRPSRRTIASTCIAQCVDDVSVADVAAQKLAVVVFDGALESEVAHHGRDERSSAKSLRSEHPCRTQSHDHIAIDLVAFLVDHDDSIGVSVESNPDICAPLPHLTRARLWMERANFVVDVLSVGAHTNGVCLCAEL